MGLEFLPQLEEEICHFYYIQVLFNCPVNFDRMFPFLFCGKINANSNWLIASSITARDAFPSFADIGNRFRCQTP